MRAISNVCVIVFLDALNEYVELNCLINMYFLEFGRLTFKAFKYFLIVCLDLSFSDILRSTLDAMGFAMIVKNYLIPLSLLFHF